MGKFRKIQAINWPVTVKLARGNNKFDSEKIEIKFKRLTADEMKDISLRHQITEDMSESEKAEIGDRIIDDVKDMIVGWSIDDETNEPMPFNDENLDLVMNHPDYRNAIIKGFYDVQIGGAAKN